MVIQFLVYNDLSSSSEVQSIELTELASLITPILIEFLGVLLFNPRGRIPFSDGIYGLEWSSSYSVCSLIIGKSVLLFYLSIEANECIVWSYDEGTWRPILLEELG